MAEREPQLAVFIDVDNAFRRFDNESLRRLFDRLAGIGTIHLCRAYADWSALGTRAAETMRWGITPVHLYLHGVQRKNAADIAVSVDAMESMYLTEQLDTFVLVTGDADLAPLATRLRERGKTVIGFGRRASTSQFLVRACHRFEYLEDDAEPEAPAAASGRRKPRRAKARAAPAAGPATDEARAAQLEAFAAALSETLAEAERAGQLPLNAGRLKERLSSRLPDLSERELGAKTFVELLEQRAAALGLRIERTSAGTVRVHRAAPSAGAEEPSALADEPPEPFDLEAARDLLERALEATGGTRARLGVLKQTMQRLSPAFNERELGFRRFLDFVVAQRDLVTAYQEGDTSRWMVRPADDT